MMMELMMNLPDDIFRLEILQYLAVHDIVNLDSACMNHKYRPQLMDKISGAILTGAKNSFMKASLFKWLVMRRIYLIKMKILVSYFDSTPAITENNFVDQFRYTQNVEMSGRIRDNMVIFIISHCPCLLSIDIGDADFFSYPEITDHTLQSMAEYCTGLQSLTLNRCRDVTDVGLITMSEHCTNLQSLKVDNCDQIKDASIISISTHCAGLQSLNLNGCQITDVSIISISTQCTRLQSLNLRFCLHINDSSIISISENCTGLKELNVSDTNITDASLTAIAKNCTRLQLLRTIGCNGLSSYKLCRHYKSISELRAVLLSIYPSLPI